MKKNKYFALATLLCATTVSASDILDSVLPAPLTQIPLALCQKLETTVSEVRPTLPIVIDLAVILADVSTETTNTGCEITYYYDVISEPLALIMSDSNGLSKEDNIEWLKTDVGNATMKESLTMQVSDLIEYTMADMVSYKGFKATFEYQFDKDGIKDITIIAADTRGE